MNSTARHWEGGLTMAGWSTSKAKLRPRGNRLLVRRCEAGWGGATTEAFQTWGCLQFSLGVSVDVRPEGALCDPVKMVFTDPSCNTDQGV